MKEPQKLSLEDIWNAYVEKRFGMGKVFFSRDRLAVIIGGGSLLFRHFMRLRTPYLIEEYRCGMVVKGSARGIINLHERVLERGMLVFVTPGTIIEPLEVGDDFRLIGTGIPAELFRLVHGDRLPPAFNGHIKDGQLPLSDEEKEFIEGLYETLWQMVHKPSVGKEAIRGMLSTITWHFNDLFMAGNEGTTKSRTAPQSLFDRFISLVNQHSVEHRKLSFYADKLCITKRYLGTAVRQASGITAKTWIDRAVATNAKVMLRHTSKQAAQIAADLNFPNPSFFCKFFKRIEGCTPEEYRMQDTPPKHPCSSTT